MRLTRLALRPAAAVAALAALAACGDDSVSPSASADAAQFRRLVVADSGNFARIYGLADGARVDSMGGLPGRITYLYTATGRVAAANFQAQNRVAFIDAGAYEQNGRGVLAAPRILGTHADQAPAHGNANGSLLAAHFDGSGNVAFWDEQLLAQGNVTPLLTVSTGPAHHGAAVAVSGDYVSASVRAASGTAPDGIVVFNRQGQRVDSTRACPALHGLAAGSAGVLYGCQEGTMYVSTSGGRPTFTASKNPDAPAMRVATVWGSPAAANFLVRMTVPGQPVGPTTRVLGVADVAARVLRPVALPGGDLDWVTSFDWSGTRALVLSYSGTLYVIDVSTRQVTGQVANLVPARPASGAVLDPYFATAAGVAYVASPTQGRVYEVTVGAGAPAVARTMNVGGTPLRLAVMGVREDKRLQAAE
jgi:hypothetical protein